MKSYKKYLITLAALAAATAALTACGSKPAAQAPAETTVAAATAAETTAAQTTAAEVPQKSQVPLAAEPETETEAETEAAPMNAELAAAYAAPGPNDKLTLPFANESAFHPEDYKDLAKTGTMPEAEIDHVFEGVSDMMVHYYDQANTGAYEYIYGPQSTQLIVNDNGTRVINAYSTNGDPLLDAAMKKVGYSDYTIDYYYTSGVWRSQNEDCNAPVHANLLIDGNRYYYIFSNGELVRRDGPDGTALNPETNEFMNTIYKVGCYYGNVLGGTANRYSLFVTTPTMIKKYDDAFVITAALQGRKDTYSFVIDADTKFDPECELDILDKYEKGDTVLSWYSKLYAAAEEEIATEQYGDNCMALLGIFEVKTEGSHVDALCGSYWWD